MTDVAVAHRLLVERQPGGVVGDRVDALLGQRGHLGGRLDVHPGHLALVDPVAAWRTRARPGAGRRRAARRSSCPRGPSACVIGVSFRLKKFSGVLSNTMPTILTLAPRATRGDAPRRVSARPASARPVSTLAIESPEPFEFSSVTSRPAPCEVALLERHPVGGVVADGEPVQREDELLRRLRRGRRHDGEGRARRAQGERQSAVMRDLLVELRLAMTPDAGRPSVRRSAHGASQRDSEDDGAVQQRGRPPRSRPGRRRPPACSCCSAS